MSIERQSSETNLLPLIAEPEQLQEHLDNPELLIIDVPVNGDSYRQGHVPGAIYLDFRYLMRGEGPVPNDVPSVEALSRLFSALGLTRDTHVVAYDDEGGGWAARLLWTLELIGHTRYSYLNGGIHAWRDAGLEESREPTAPSPSEYHAEILNPNALISCDEIKDLRPTGVERAPAPVVVCVPGVRCEDEQRRTRRGGRTHHEAGVGGAAAIGAADCGERDEVEAAQPVVIDPLQY